MVGLKSSSDAMKEVVELLGLTEDQTKIYFSVLSLGAATLGQISLLSGLDYLKTQEALEVLVGSSLVRRIPGKVGRYIALSPFLKAFLLAYDPITLLSIRKESAAVFKTQVNQITEHMTKEIEVGGQNTDQLQKDFLTGLEPVLSNFGSIIDSTRGLLNSTEQHIRASAKKLQLTSNQLAFRSQKFTDELKKANIEKVNQIPELFNPFIPKVDDALKKSILIIKQELDKIVSAQKVDLQNLRADLSIKQRKTLDDIVNLLQKVEDDNKSAEEGIHKKTIETTINLTTLRENATSNKRYFKDIRNGYKNIDTTVMKFFTELDARLMKMEPLIASALADIQNRKMFRGRDEFLDILTDIENTRSSIQTDMKGNSELSSKINHLNQLLEEIEIKILDATENGLTQVETILTEESQQFSRKLQKMSVELRSIDRPKIQEIFEKTQRSLITQLTEIEQVLDVKHNLFLTTLQDQTHQFSQGLNTLIDTFTNDFRREIENHYEKSGIFDPKTTELGWSIQEIDNIAIRQIPELTRAFSEVDVLRESFDRYILGLDSMCSNFTENQVRYFVEVLDKAKIALDSQIKRIENQLEQEISALTFSIRQMKQKLNTIIQTSQLPDISGIDPTLLSTDLVVGEPVIIMLLRDLTVRTKASLTILMPRPELQTLIQASKLPYRTRVSIIGDFQKVPRSTLKKILAAGNIRLKQLDGVDYWACIRDAEEMLICPEPKDPTKEGLIGVISTNQNLVELFSQEVITYTTRSREILIQDIE
ncbi:MAG: helix-turn-helix domain-containing protein [Candidatus Heimdallarchaeota archaeon]